MEANDHSYCLDVWGPYALFTNPLFKVERYSYPVITPSAARGIFQNVFWKPAFNWVITRIDVLNPIKRISIRRNETAKLASLKGKPFYIEDVRQLRGSEMLKDVRYRLFAKQVYIPVAKRDKRFHNTGTESDSENPAKYRAIFERRASDGQCYNTPYLGTRECSCFYRLVTDLSKEPPALSESRDFDYMLYDMKFYGINLARPMIYRAEMINGTITVPDPSSELVKR